MNFLQKVDKAKELIQQTLKQYEKVAVACSFGKDSMVVVHLCRSIKPDIQVFSVMTPFKPPETLGYKEGMTKMWGLNIKTYQREDVEPIYKRDVDACCQYYKVDMTKEAVRGLDAWISGLRRSEGRTRANYDYIEERGGLIKVNPILDFTELDVWRYLAVYHIPVNPLYAQGYRSLGCEPCSRKEVDETETERAGRWQGTKKQGLECGIHSCPLR